jgi:DNA-binding MarR family transcriptional regulator
MLSSAGMTKRLDRLERLGLVRRKPDPKDRRGVTIELTPAGRQVLTKAVADNTQRETALLVGLKQSERRELGDLLRRVLRNVEPPTGG